MMKMANPIIPPPPHLLKKFSAQARHEADKRNGPGYFKTFAALCIEWAMTNDRQIRSSEITPTPELLEQWEAETAHTTKDESWHVAVQAARWGADQELKACCVLMDKWGLDGEDLVECRRPKPPSLKEQALKALDSFEGFTGSLEEVDTIRRALEQLND